MNKKCPICDQPYNKTFNHPECREKAKNTIDILNELKKSVTYEPIVEVIKVDIKKKTITVK